MHAITSPGRLITADKNGPNGGIHFELATAKHDAQIRRLLRENPFPGEISLSMEREPSFFKAAALEGPEHHTIIAIKQNRIVCAGTVSARQRFINGLAMRVGYLGGLRLDSSCRGQSSILRRGYDRFRQLHEQGGPPIYFTSIIADNLPARRLLERGLSGMPTYRLLGEFVTMIIRRRSRTARARKEIQFLPGSKAQSADILKLLNQNNQRYQLAPAWSPDEIYPVNFRIAYSPDGTALVCASLWDQRTIKQIVVRGYSAQLRRAQPLINLAATVLGRPRLPPIGMPLSHAFISHIAGNPDQPELLKVLIDQLHGPAAESKIHYLTLGFDRRDPRLTHLRKAFHPREYVSRIYAVHWEDGAALAESLDNRLLAPEVAIL